MRTYNEWIGLVRSWANRDEEVISNSIIADCLSYAADKAYRYLRVPPLERIITFDSSDTLVVNNINETTEIVIPEDLIEFIQIRTVDSDGKTVRVFNEKADVRTFYDQYAEKYSGLGYWTRKGNKMVLAPAIDTDNETVELYYYRRLFALDARIEVTAANANISNSYITEVSSTDDIPTNLRTGNKYPSANLKKAVYTLATTGAVMNTVYYETSVADASIPLAPLGQVRTITTVLAYGSEVYHWLKDDNERVLLDGALAEAFGFLREPETAQMYSQQFMSEIDELNREEKSRKASGGNVQINFNSYGLI